MEQENNQKILADFNKEVEKEQDKVEKTTEEVEEKVEEEPTEEANKKLIDSLEDFEPTFSEKTPEEVEKEKEQRIKEQGEKKEADGRILTIKEISLTEPKIYKMVNDEKVFVPPTKGNNCEYYDIKLKVKFEEDNIVEYYGNLKVWVNDDKLSSNINIYRAGHSKVSVLSKMALVEMAKQAKADGHEDFELVTEINNDKVQYVVKGDKEKFDKFSKSIKDKEIFDFLIGKKVKIKTSKGVYDGKSWFRNDIEKIIVE